MMLSRATMAAPASALALALTLVAGLVAVPAAGFAGRDTPPTVTSPRLKALEQDVAAEVSLSAGKPASSWPRDMT
jgi:hypothetical protein